MQTSKQCNEYLHVYSFVSSETLLQVIHILFYSLNYRPLNLSVKIKCVNTGKGVAAYRVNKHGSELQLPKPRATKLNSNRSFCKRISFFENAENS